MRTKALVPFLVLSFALTWGIAALLSFFMDPIVAIFGEINARNPLCILAPMFNSARGSLLIAYLDHVQMMNPIWPDAQSWDSLPSGLVAVLIVLLNRRTMFAKGTGVNEVLRPAELPVCTDGSRSSDLVLRPSDERPDQASRT